VRIEHKTYMKFVYKVLKSTEIKHTYTFQIHSAKQTKQSGHMSVVAIFHIPSFVKMHLQGSVPEFPY
jgi:hypothetical protein